MRYWTSMLALAAALLCATASARDVTVSVAGRTAGSTPGPAVVNGHLLLPAAFLVERLGMRVETTGDPGSWRIISYGRYLRVSKDSVRFVVGTTESEAAFPAQVLDGRLHVPVEMITRAFGIGWGTRAGGGHELRPPGADVRDVRQGRHDTYLRLVFDLTAPAPFWLTRSPGELDIELPPPDPRPADWGHLRLFTFTDPMRPRVTARQGDAGWLRLNVTYQDGLTPSLSTLGDPPRLVLDIPRATPVQPPAAPAPSPAAPPAPPRVVPEPVPALPPALATGWEVRNFGTERGPVRVFVLRATPSAVRPALAAATIRQRARVSSIATREGALAAVNGGYFDHGGPPLGMLVIDGEWIKHPIRNRAVLGITEHGAARMDRLRFEGAVRIPGLDKLDIDGLNTGHWQSDTLMLYTRRWGQDLVGSTARLRVVVGSDGRVARKVADGQAVSIPRDGYVVSAAGKPAMVLGRATVGAPVEVTLATVPAWPGLRHAVGAGPQLVVAGERNVTTQEEMFRNDVLRACSRTAVGIGADGNLIIAAAEASGARGLTLWELASVMWKLGCRDAMALDGGGSTTVVARGRVVNRPMDGTERPVSNALLVFGQPGT